ncbi:MAG: hypothetical protein AB7O62_14545 [Pirellulales bacterium]
MAQAYTPTKPTKVFRLRGISARVFENHSRIDGRDVCIHKVTLQQFYRDGDEWKLTNYFTRDNLPIARLLLERAWHFILESEVKPGREETKK